MAAASRNIDGSIDTRNYDSEDTDKDLEHAFVTSIMERSITINDLLEFANTENYDLINTLTKTYLRISKNGVLFVDTDNSSITFMEYFKKITHLTESKFSCIHRAVNTRVAEMFLINTLYYFYTKVYPDNLSKFEEFTEIVVDFLTQQQGGNICVFDGPREILPKQFFVNLVTGSIISLSLLQSRKCRTLNTSLYSRGLKFGDPLLNKLKKDIQKTCAFFKSIDTKSYEEQIKKTFNIPSTKGGTRLYTKFKKKRRKTRTNKKIVTRKSKKVTKKRRKR